MLHLSDLATKIPLSTKAVMKVLRSKPLFLPPTEKLIAISSVSAGTANNTTNKSWAGCILTIHPPTSLH